MLEIALAGNFWLKVGIGVVQFLRDRRDCVTVTMRWRYVQGEENKRLVGFLPAAGYTGWGVEVARILVVVLGSENEGG